MKKNIDFTTLAILVVAATGLVAHYDVGRELGIFLKSMIHKLAPWINTAVYS